jgi:Putative DNA-binding domain
MTLRCVHPLFEVDRNLVDRDMLDSFLDLAVAENFTVDYKGAADGSALTTIAAFANTFGGVVLVGVDWDKHDKERPGKIKPVANSQRESFNNQMVGMFSPRWVPEIIPIAIDADHSVLVVRVFPDLVPRPLMYKGTVPIRRESRNDTASLAEIQSLFAEQRVTYQTITMGPGHNPRSAYPSIRHDITAPAVVVRAFTSAPVLRNVHRPHLDRGTHNAVASALTMSRLPMHILRQMRHGEGLSRVARAGRCRSRVFLETIKGPTSI